MKTKKSLFLVVLFSLFFVLFFSCGSDSEDDYSMLLLAGAGGKTVYTAGYYDNGSDYVACYWKNGTKTYPSN